MTIPVLLQNRFSTKEKNKKYSVKVYDTRSLAEQKYTKNIKPDILDFIKEFIPLNDPTTNIMESSSRFDLNEITDDEIISFVNLRTVNNIRYLNKFFEAVNHKMMNGGVFICCAETKDQRKQRILSKFPKAIAYPYYTADFVLKRLMPKSAVTKKLYFAITHGRNRVLALTEVLGRLVSSGFEIINHTEIDGKEYFAVRKIDKPAYAEKPSYGPFFKMRRVGKDGKIIHVYKVRTMHPYSEYLQKYIHDRYSLKEGGKFNNDIRVTNWGKIFRKLWLDELPMLINWLKRDLKFVGVRPLSDHYLSLYDEELRQLRLKHKPGLFPPYYADLPKTLDEIMDSEKRYLKAYSKNPVKTDMVYFWRAFNNIVIKKARSQ